VVYGFFLGRGMENANEGDRSHNFIINVSVRKLPQEVVQLLSFDC
jgi:hypothetical protein